MNLITVLLYKRQNILKHVQVVSLIFYDTEVLMKNLATTEYTRKFKEM